jgi:TP901 family phage tail tape measure protein
MNKAAGAASGFAQKTLGAVEKVDSAISGTAAKLAAFGLTFSVGAAAKGIIEMDHRMTRMGLSANASAEQVSKMKQAIFDVAQASDIKIDPTKILSGLEVIGSQTSDFQYAEENIRNIALAIQATGESGESMGALFSEFKKFGYSVDQISSLMDDMVAQSDQGAFTFAEFAKAAPAVFSAYSAIGTSPEHIKKANAAMQILVAGTKSPEIAVTALNATMNELSDPEKQKKLRALGIRVRDSSGDFRDFNDIMFDIVGKANKMGNADLFGSIFGSVSMQAIRSYMTQGERMYESLIDLGDTTGFLQEKSAKMAGTLQSNLLNLQTAFSRFADSNLTKPLEALTELLNKFAEDPERIKKVFTGIAIGIGAIAAVKGIAGITRLIGSISQLKSGNVNITESLSMAQAMPVYVTNWGSNTGMPGIGSAGQVQQ